MKSFTSKVNYFTDLRTNQEKADKFNLSYMPQNEKEAYAIQSAVIKKLGYKILGWKLGGTNFNTQRIFNCDSGYLGPVFSVSNEVPTRLEIEAPVGEAELTFRISNEIRHLNLKRIQENPYSYFDVVYPSLELPYSKIKNFHDVGMLPLVADLCGTGHLALGKPKKISAFDYKIAFEVKINQGEIELTKGNSNNIVGGFKTALSDFLKLALEYSLQVEPGQYVATGGITDCISLPKYQKIDLDFTEFESMTFQYPS